jgi:Ni,Fe-hydrogenase III large subunit
MTVNLGPQHPSTHGVLRLIVTLDGEQVVRVVPLLLLNNADLKTNGKIVAGRFGQ